MVPVVGDVDSLRCPSRVYSGVAVVAADAPAVACQCFVLFIADAVLTAERAGQKRQITVGGRNENILDSFHYVVLLFCFGIWGGAALSCAALRECQQGLEVVCRECAADVGVRTNDVIIAKKIIVKAGVQRTENGIDIVAAALLDQVADVEPD